MIITDISVQLSILWKFGRPKGKHHVVRQIAQQLPAGLRLFLPEAIKIWPGQNADSARAIQRRCFQFVSEAEVISDLDGDAARVQRWRRQLFAAQRSDQAKSRIRQQALDNRRNSG